MKHLLLILSILLLSSPLLGQETGVLYQYETSSGIQWKTFGDGKVQPKYKGEIKNGKMDGLGVLTYPYGEKSVVGEWKDGKEWNTKHHNKNGDLIGKYVYGDMILGVLFFSLGFENETFVYKWNKYGNEGKDEKYEGEINNGEPNGQGVSHLPKIAKYEGEWKDGKKQGKGTWTFLDGGKYVGEFKDGWQHGQGTFTHPLGEKYVGEWKDGKIHGQGTWTLSDGQKYVGEFKEDKKHGQGTFTYGKGKWEGQKYVGEFKDGAPWIGILYDPHGNIIEKIVNGVEVVGKKHFGVLFYREVNGEFGWYKNGDDVHDRKYVGDIVNGTPNGQGTLTWSDGGKYVGEFMHGKEHGQGTKTQSNGIKYVGRWKNGLPNGQGTMTTPDGGKYVGEFKNLKKHGQGTKTFPDGREYVGEYKDDYYHGQGTFTFPDGRKFVGEFKEGKPWNSILSKYGRIVGTWVNGVLQK